jgi:hypothetical protein
MNEEWPLLIIAVLVGTAIFGVACWFSDAECRSQWRASGFRTDWGPVKGCLISKDGQIWIPADNYREIK